MSFVKEDFSSGGPPNGGAVVSSSREPCKPSTEACEPSPEPAPEPYEPSPEPPGGWDTHFENEVAEIWRDGTVITDTGEMILPGMGRMLRLM